MTSLLLTSTDAASSGAGAILILVMLGIGFFLWFLPGIVASTRHHHNVVAIWLITILLGWTLLGWIVAIVWSFTNPPPQQPILINNAR
jgi:hypothetical protein